MSAGFTFRAVDGLGGAVRGRVEASNEAAVVEELRGRGLTVLEVRSSRRGSVLTADLGDLRPVSGRDLAVMTRQLSTMIESGLTILRALSVLEEQTEVARIRATLTSVRQDIEAGSSLSDALSRHPKVFSTVYVAMVRAGETGGFLEDALRRVADQLEADEALRREVRAAMVYPAAVTVFALAVMTAMIAFIVPVFAKIFKEQGATLPALTRITMNISDALRHYPWAFVGGIALVVFLFVRWKRSEGGRLQWDRLKLRAPLGIGKVVLKVALARWSRTLSSLVTAGVPMLEAIEVTGRTAGNRVIEDAMTTVRDSVHAGGTIGGALATQAVFPGMVGQMVTVGEETGALGTTLAKVADFYEAEVAVAIKTLTSVLEPAMIILVGGLVGFIVVSMYLPMFDVYNHIQ
ncbi:MAG TPA: type II secretion system F family protein [Solirubrobacteraceae bacterium]|nr:type II secretion system F family protein [Solirubrobacteraceae bacterium]